MNVKIIPRNVEDKARIAELKTHCKRCKQVKPLDCRDVCIDCNLEMMS